MRGGFNVPSMSDYQRIRLAILLLLFFAVHFPRPTIVYWLEVAAVIGLTLLVIGVVGSLIKKGLADQDAPGKNVPAGAEGNAIIIAAIVQLAVVAVLLFAGLVLK